MRCAWLLVATLAGCEPGFPLPTVHGPSVTWSPPQPDPRGPCIQTTRWGKRTWMWKRGIELPRGSFDQSLVDATDDDRDAHTLAVRALGEDRGAIAAAAMAVGSWWTGVIVAVAQPTRDHDAEWMAGGGALAVGGLATAIALAISSGRDHARAIATYNASCRR
jgi:hypothetical protein